MRSLGIWTGRVLAALVATAPATAGLGVGDALEEDRGVRVLPLPDVVLREFANEPKALGLLRQINRKIAAGAREEAAGLAERLDAAVTETRAPSDRWVLEVVAIRLNLLNALDRHAESHRVLAAAERRIRGGARAAKQGRAVLARFRANTLISERKFDDACDASEAANLALAEVFDPGDVQVARGKVLTAVCLARALKFEAASKTLEEAVAAIQREVGLDGAELLLYSPLRVLLRTIEGDFDAAEEILRHNLEILAEILEPTNPDLPAARSGLVGYLRAVGRHKEAHEEATVVLAALGHLVGIEDPRLIEALENRMWTSFWMGDLEQARGALEQLREAPRTKETLRSHLSADLARGLLHVHAGEARRAVEVIQDAAYRMEKEFGSRDLALTSAWRLLAITKVEAGDVAGGLASMKKALDLSGEILGLGSVWSLTLRGELGDMKAVNYELDEARTLLKTAEYNLDRFRWIPAPKRAILHNGLGFLALTRGQLARAEDEFRKARDFMEGVVGPESPTLAHSELELARALLARRKMDEARDAYLRARKLARRYPRGTPTRRRMREFELRIFLLRGRLDRVVQGARQAAKLLESMGGAGHPETAPLHLLEGEAHRWRGDAAAARVAYQKVVQVAERAKRHHHPEIHRARVGLALLDARAAPARAIQRAATAVEALRGIYGGTHPELAEILTLQAEVLRRAGKPDESRTALGAARNILRRVAREERTYMVPVHVGRARLHQDAGETAAALRHIRTAVQAAAGLPAGNPQRAAAEAVLRELGG